VQKYAVRMILVATLVLMPALLLGQTLAPEAGGGVQLPRAVVVDSDSPPNVVGQAIIQDQRRVAVVIRYGSCPVPLELGRGQDLQGPENTFYLADNCVGTPYVDTNAAKLSVLGTGCELFVVNGDNEVFYVDPATAATAPLTPYESKLTDSDAGCLDVNQGPFPLVKATEPKIGDLDDLFVPPFKLEQ
jgi:hypothetical protein